jgi:survival motor neuron protein
MSSPKSGKLLFSKESVENEVDDEDIWDDTALIKAYDRCVRQMKKAIGSKLRAKNEQDENEEEMDEEDEVDDEEEEDEDYYEENDEDVDDQQTLTTYTKVYSTKSDWKVGDYCQAIFEEDGLVYPAIIEKIFDPEGENKRTRCSIKYLYYLNEEDKFLDELMEYKPNEENNEGQKEEKKDTQTEKMEKCEKNRNFSIPNLPIPPLPFAVSSLMSKQGNEVDDEEALYSMLMSWYMSGYHTGYYYGKMLNKNIEKNANTSKGKG